MYTPSPMSWLSILTDMVSFMIFYHVHVTILVRGYTQFNTLLPFIYS